MVSDHRRAVVGHVILVRDEEWVVLDWDSRQPFMYRVVRWDPGVDDILAWVRLAACVVTTAPLADERAVVTRGAARTMEWAEETFHAVDTSPDQDPHGSGFTYYAVTLRGRTLVLAGCRRWGGWHEAARHYLEMRESVPITAAKRRTSLDILEQLREQHERELSRGGHRG